MKKRIELEIDFPEGFVPPEKFDYPGFGNNWHSKCDLCPFYWFDDDYGFGTCAILGEYSETDECPIKKQFN